ncbi:hypothetical protein GCM10007079_20710 [Nocardiopsis terrae]|uniref:Uncharacterized protein n=1 Tax=Nocardiopsis terrae TaxID=372655 RepID=A0ABR9HH15_9ACTN|nr:hypothetical protein [Nocardiopsis terrae]MBE1458311.1 hypothetical protein [Nocardiopsis terrae]GHC81196.1 hypothetical protein GCM10007079_20710 [Nocardiopsis terrae]
MRKRKIRATIPQPCDQREHHRGKGGGGRWAPAFDQVAHRDRNTVERALDLLRQTREVAPPAHRPLGRGPGIR